MKAASDTSPLLFLSKIKRLDFLSGIELYMPPQVLEEIRNGEVAGHPDYLLIEKMMEKLTVRIQTTKMLSSLPSNLGSGECASISLAVEQHIKLILIDEARGRQVARLYGLTPRGTLGILLEQYHKERISKKECRELVFELVRKGYRISEEILVVLLRELE